MAASSAATLTATVVRPGAPVGPQTATSRPLPGSTGGSGVGRGVDSRQRLQRLAPARGRQGVGAGLLLAERRRHRRRDVGGR